MSKSDITLHSQLQVSEAGPWPNINSLVFILDLMQQPFSDYHLSGQAEQMRREAGL